MRKALLALALWLMPISLLAQTVPPSRLSSGASLPAACAYGSIWYLTSGIVGFYDCSAPTTGWRFTGSVLPTLRVGNNSPALTGPISYVSGNHVFSGAIAATQMFGQKWYTTWSPSGAMTAPQVGSFIYGDIVGTQAATEVYGTLSQMNASTTGLVGKLEGLRAITSRTAGDLSTGRGLTTFSTYGSGVTAVDYAGIEVYTPTLTGTGAINIGRNLLLNQPPQTGALNFWRSIYMASAATPLTANSMQLEIDGPNSSHFRLWDIGTIDSYPIVTADYFKVNGSGSSYQPAQRFQTFITPQNDTTYRYVGADLELYVEDKQHATVQAAEAYAELDGDADVTGSLIGLGAEYGHYSTATVPTVNAIYVGGGNGGGGTITNLQDVLIDVMWDNTSTTVNRTALQINPVTEGTTLNRAINYTNASSQNAGISGGGASYDAPENQSFGATVTLTPATSSVRMTCTDGAGCAVTLGETGVFDGQIVRFVNVSTNTCNFADTGGVTELAGAFAAGQWDTLALQYITDRWVELSRSNN